MHCLCNEFHDPFPPLKTSLCQRLEKNYGNILEGLKCEYSTYKLPYNKCKKLTLSRVGEDLGIFQFFVKNGWLTFVPDSIFEHSNFRKFNGMLNGKTNRKQPALFFLPDFFCSSLDKKISPFCFRHIALCLTIIH